MSFKPNMAHLLVDHLEKLQKAGWSVNHNKLGEFQTTFQCGWMDGQTDGQTESWVWDHFSLLTDGWMDGRMHRVWQQYLYHTSFVLTVGVSAITPQFSRCWSCYSGHHQCCVCQGRVTTWPFTVALSKIHSSVEGRGVRPYMTLYVIDRATIVACTITGNYLIYF